MKRIVEAIQEEKDRKHQTAKKNMGKEEINTHQDVNEGAEKDIIGNRKDEEENEKPNEEKNN